MRYISQQAWEIYEQQHRIKDVPVDKVSFMGGMSLAVQILRGDLDVGLPADIKSSQVAQQILDEMQVFADRELLPLMTATREKELLFQRLAGFENLASERRN